MIDKFWNRVTRLSYKIDQSATPVPGFIVGLSGTDSIVAFLLCYQAASKHDMAHRVYGIHYKTPGRPQPTWFEKDVLPWLREKAPDARLEVHSPLGANEDQFRWADLHLRALNEIEEREDGRPRVRLLPGGENYWVVGTINATERALGTYSLLADSASVQPLHTLNKSTILAICEELGVPETALEMARFPDCMCGRDEIAAQNVELIDDILRHDIDFHGTHPSLMQTVVRHIGEQKAMNGFKERIPYTI